MMAESQFKRLANREEVLQDKLERTQERLTDERDIYRNRVNSLVGIPHRGRDDLRLLETAQGEIRPNVNLTTLANEIEKVAEQAAGPAEPRPASSPREGGDPLPSFLAAGPRTVRRRSDRMADEVVQARSGGGARRACSV